ncbi:hypothetical protein FHW04_004538 [Pantoea sp. AN62]|uniref:hypothetical protein n=1 Tax=Pantoea TaxID=53335 RepID=UPI000A24E4BE|nr:MULTISPECIES: hypothetical protein [Pantoea]MCQ5472814.1 hypothetical protein [Pantoea brenneri]MDU4748672.1 hypothetical protein [Pantoea sp.]ORM54211.1 hypothetical protein HA39_17850 [Pantoea brenneri]OXM18673.1 hypothetical protein CBI35_21800 [Pantoea sp. AV62]
MNTQRKSASFKKNGQLNSFGLRRAVEMIDNENLPRSARVILSQVCQVAASTSAYKITMSRKRMAELCGTQEATIRRNLRKAVEANILTECLIFDKSEKGRGQLPTEYQFTAQFLTAAAILCKTLDTAAKEAISKARTLFAKFLHSLRAFFSGPNTPRSKIPAFPDQNDRQELVCFENKNSKNLPATAEKNFEGKNVKSLKDAQHERAVTKSSDYARTQEAERAERAARNKQFDTQLRRRAFATGQATRRQPGTSQKDAPVHNPEYMKRIAREHDERWDESIKSFKQTQASGFSPKALLEEVRKKAAQARASKTGAGSGQTTGVLKKVVHDVSGVISSGLLPFL